MNPDSAGDGELYTLRIVGDAPREETEVLGFQMDSQSDVPTFLGVDWGALLTVGCNSELYLIQRNFESYRRVELDSRFNSFFVYSRVGRLLVSSETALIAFDDRHSAVWRVDLDIVTAVRWQESSVHVEQMDGPTLKVDVLTGTAKDCS